MLLFDHISSILLQFHLPNADAVPATIKNLSRRKAEEGNLPWVKHSNGVLVIPPTKNCSILDLLGDFSFLGYEISEAYYYTSKRPDPKDPSKVKTEHVVRFLYSHPQAPKAMTAEFYEVREVVKAELQGMCTATLWRLRMHSNPFCGEDGEEMEGQRFVSIDIDAREQLYRDDGKPTMVWERDDKGKALPKPPHRLKAEHGLRIVGRAGILALTSA